MQKPFSSDPLESNSQHDVPSTQNTLVCSSCEQGHVGARPPHNNATPQIRKLTLVITVIHSSGPIQASPVVPLMFFVAEGSRPGSHTAFSCLFSLAYSIWNSSSVSPWHDLDIFEDYKPGYPLVWVCVHVMSPHDRFRIHVLDRNVTESMTQTIRRHQSWFVPLLVIQILISSKNYVNGMCNQKRSLSRLYWVKRLLNLEAWEGMK